ncbi:peptide ABC transporter permease [Bacillus sp. UMB0728]|uniref:peptide ABC transporter permease n=1 Tax=Bacillus sp. UMB0728 TaxID=2066052 RepID=UPI000C773D87|nr:peptide ABC transporter permease [Bacillus sp. UMB0728]PLR74217.1 peptide ABC transporter permease [Bacillus sp. UMB0728]
MSYMRSILTQAAGFLVLLLIAALPLYLYNLDGKVIFLPSKISGEILDFLKGLFTGDSYYYMQGDRKRFLLFDLLSFFSVSYVYVSVSLSIVIVLSFIFGIWLWKKSEKWVNSILGFVGFIPDFILVLLLQLFVTYIYKQTGMRVAKVASLSLEEPAILLPVLTLTILPLLYLVRSLNDRTFEVASEDYILTAVSKGLTKRQIYLYHVTSNVLPFLKADIYKIVGITTANLFIIEHLYNTRGLTEILFEYPVNFGYQYNLVVISLLSFFILYIAVLFTMKLFIFGIEKVLLRG